MYRCPYRLFALLVALSLALQTEGVSVCPTRKIQATEGEVTSPNHPFSYPSDVDCTLTIDGRQNVVFKIKFDAFSVEEDEENPGKCSFDALTIIDGPKTSRFCGGRIPSEYTSTRNEISLRFESDNSFQMTGFKVSFSTVDGPKAPNGTSICPSREIDMDQMDKMEGALYSPHFPNSYPHNQSCTFTLNVRDNFKTVVWFESFFLQFHQQCQHDKLVLSDELGGNTQCGGGEDRVPPPLELNGRKLQFAFTTDGDTSAGGFYLKYNITKIQQGRCVCTPGLSYITINNYKPRNNRSHDDVRFEFKSTQSSGMIMYLKGLYRDFLYVAYKNSNVFMVHIDLGTGQVNMEPSSIRLNDNTWHKVHITRVDRSVRIVIDDGVVNLVGRTPGGYTRFDIPTPTTYFLGSPANLNLLPNFNGCIRDFSVDGYEPITNAWISKPDYAIVRKTAMRECSSAD
ncbi:zinc metalloproteinase nas-39-like [Montipora foliosa]|uniref:zinc metalloproteinase nas-39-like n=1 Tax=Montipora foliosa TaxID=591990 RepID=UPI0035F1C289